MPLIMAGVAFFDIDYTLCKGFTIFPLYEAYANEGFIDPTKAAELQDVLHAYEAGESEYHPFVLRTLQLGAEIVRGKRADIATKLASEFFGSDSKWYGYVEPTLNELRARGVALDIVTAEPQFIGEGARNALGMDQAFSSRYAVDASGAFTGEVEGALGSQQKRAAITGRLAEHGTDDVYGFGDSDGDIDMLMAASEGNSFCITPSPKLREMAEQKGWNIIDNPDTGLSVVSHRLQ